MVWLHGSSSVALALALAGCGTFVQAESGTDGEDGSSGTSGGTNATVTPSTSGETNSGSGGPGTTPVTSSSGTTTTDPTNTTTTDPSDTIGPTTSSTAGESTEGTDPTETTSGTGETTDDTGEESTGPGVCEPIDTRPNGSPDEAAELGEIPCGRMTYDFNGTIEDGGDVDWIEFFGDWTCGSPNPQVVVDVVDDNVEVCVTPQCALPATAFYGCVEGSNWNEGGDLGCCSTNRVEMNVNCANTDNESLVARIRVRNNKAVCEDYTVQYAFEVQ